MLEPRMLTMGGVFYPTGYVFAMFPNPDDADKVGAALQDAGFCSDDIMLLKPEAILDQVSPTANAVAGPMPSVGTEAATVRQYTELAREGHCALLIHAASAVSTQRDGGHAHGALLNGREVPLPGHGAFALKQAPAGASPTAGTDAAAETAPRPP